MLSRVVLSSAILFTLCLAPKVSAESAKPEVLSPTPALTVESIRSIAEEIRRWVQGAHVDEAGQEAIEDAAGCIRRYDWNDPNKVVRTYTRKALCKQLVRQYNRLTAESAHEGCKARVEDCLRALERSDTYDDKDFRCWKGLHQDTNRGQEHPDDAYWFDPVWWKEQQCWRQDVVWAGENPRRGWHCAGPKGLWGWDPKLKGHPERGPGVQPLDDDGQHGWKGVHAGYPFECADGCKKYILWILPKEAYLESINTKGLRVAAGLWHGYTWTVDRKAEPSSRLSVEPGPAGT
jgi:hypothetical protein